MEIRLKEEEVRRELSARFASQHRYDTAAQVVLDGKLVAEINEAGGDVLEGGLAVKLQ